MGLKKTNLAVAVLMLLICLAIVLCVGGCKNDDGDVDTEFNAKVIVQLVKASDNNPYSVANLKLFLEDEDGKVVSALTDSTGKAVFPVAALGKYEVIRVEGLDVMGGAEGAVGLEFVKASPISTPVPQTVHTYTVYPSAIVAGKQDQVEVQSPIPTVRKVTIIKKDSVDTPDETRYDYYASGAVAGRMIISNRNCDCNGGLYVHLKGSGTFMLFNLDQPICTGYMRIYNGGTQVFNIDNVGNVSDTLTIEIPGNGDWAFTSKDAVFTRAVDGLNNSQDSFVSFGRDGDYEVLGAYNFGGSHAPPNDHYRFDFEFQKFEEL